MCASFNRVLKKYGINTPTVTLLSFFPIFYIMLISHYATCLIYFVTAAIFSFFYVNYLFNNYILYETEYSRIDQVNFFKGCLPQILLGPFLNTLSHMLHVLRQPKI